MDRNEEQRKRKRGLEWRVRGLRTVAKARRIDGAGARKADIIRAIQGDEGGFVRFGTTVDGHRDHRERARRENCLPVPEARRSPA